MFGNIIRLLPPLNISDELLTEGIEILGRILGDL
jgi:4-aminobutyrate aminotransferase/(S)-3-amino-2-methylpropionate transaminase